MNPFDTISSIPTLTNDDVLGWVLPQLQRSGLWLEFGVFSGTSLRRLAEQRGAAALYGFDSFRGLPEDWRDGHPAGEFAQPVWPSVDGAALVIGLFADTLPNFYWHGPVTFVHIDCDLYSSTKCALDYVRPHLVPGAIIVFDEIFDYPGHEEHELKALREVYDDGMNFRWIVRGGEKVAIQIVGGSK